MEPPVAGHMTKTWIEGPLKQMVTNSIKEGRAVSPYPPVCLAHTYLAPLNYITKKLVWGLLSFSSALPPTTTLSPYPWAHPCPTFMQTFFTSLSVGTAHDNLRLLDFRHDKP